MMTFFSSLGSRGSSSTRSRSTTAASWRWLSPTNSSAIWRSSGSRLGRARLLGALELLARTRAQLSIGVDHRRQLASLTAELAAAVGIGRDLRVGPLGLDLLEAPLELVEPLLEAHRVSWSAAWSARTSTVAKDRPPAPDRGCPEALSRRWPSSASRIDAMATSIIESSGGLVVMRCSQMPGRNSQRIHQFSRCRAPKRSISYAIDGDDRDEQDAADDADEQALAGEQAEQQDATR